MYPVYVRGEAYLALHDGAKAAAEFEKIVGHRGIVISDPVGAMARLELGRSYAMAGDGAKAKAAYEDFLGAMEGRGRGCSGAEAGEAGVCAAALVVALDYRDLTSIRRNQVSAYSISMAILPRVSGMNLRGSAVGLLEAGDRVDGTAVDDVDGFVALEDDFDYVPVVRVSRSCRP